MGHGSRARKTVSKLAYIAHREVLTPEPVRAKPKESDRGDRRGPLTCLQPVLRRGSRAVPVDGLERLAMGSPANLGVRIPSIAVREGERTGVEI
jgi:hypothetical protein